MNEALFLDGPLAGQVLSIDGDEAPGGLLVIDVVDVGQHPGASPLLEYRVHPATAEAGPTTLRFVRRLDGAGDGEPEPVEEEPEPLSA